MRSTAIKYSCLAVIKAEMRSPRRAKKKKDDLKSHPFVLVECVYIY